MSEACPGGGSFGISETCPEERSYVGRLRVAGARAARGGGVEPRAHTEPETQRLLGPSRGRPLANGKALRGMPFYREKPKPEGKACPLLPLGGRVAAAHACSQRPGPMPCAAKLIAAEYNPLQRPYIPSPHSSVSGSVHACIRLFTSLKSPSLTRSTPWRTTCCTARWTPRCWARAPPRLRTWAPRWRCRAWPRRVGAGQGGVPVR